MVAADEETQPLLPAPKEAPLILAVPDGTDEKLAASLREYAARADTIEYLILGHHYTAAIEKLRNTSIATRLLDLVRIVRNGDLNVDELVLARIPESYSWVSWLVLKQKLESFDPRLAVPAYRLAKPMIDRFSQTAVQVVVSRLVMTGVLRRHSLGQSIRRVKPGEKLPPMEERW